MTIVDSRFAVSYYNDSWNWLFVAKNSLGFSVKELNGTTDSYSFNDFDLFSPEINDELREPNVMIIYPYVGYKVSQTIELVWSYVIPFGTTYNFTITVTDSNGVETIIATNVQGNSFFWNTRGVEDGSYSIRIEGANSYFSASDTIQDIEINNSSTEATNNGDSSLSLLIIELLVIATIILRRKKN